MRGNFSNNHLKKSIETIMASRGAGFSRNKNQFRAKILEKSRAAKIFGGELYTYIARASFELGRSPARRRRGLAHVSGFTFTCTSGYFIFMLYPDIGLKFP
jgi:hypothetical protein